MAVGMNELRKKMGKICLCLNCMYCLFTAFTENSCGSPGKILNGKYLIPEGILLGATITAQCNEG